jgi:long-subunit fatty acid transport protein
VKLGYAYSRKFGSSGDAFSSTRTDADGDRIATGVNEDDTTSGSIEVAYAFDDHWSLAGGIASSQPAKTAGGKSLRFPFFDFISPANNYTGYYLYLSYDL